MYQTFYQAVYGSCIEFSEKPYKLGVSIPIFMNGGIEVQTG